MNRVVVKIGSSSLTTPSGELNRSRIQYFAQEISRLNKQGVQVLLVTSGAVAAGYRQLGYPTRPKLLHEKQASASVGQALLMQAYNEEFNAQSCGVAQILLTRTDFAQRGRVHNALNTIEELLKRGVIPIINENDTVSTDELKFGDNDKLSALVASLIRAQQLLIFTDTDGLYDDDPRKNKNAKRINQVETIDEHIFEIAGGPSSSVGTGGMYSKLEAAKIATRSGVRVFVGYADQAGDLQEALDGTGKGTYFIAENETLSMKKQWVGFQSLPLGCVTVDQGAESALQTGGKSLLPAGVVEVHGEFKPGDVIEIQSLDQITIGRGIVNYSSEQLKEAAGLSLKQVQERMDVPRLEVIHRDEWITLVRS